ncbi:Palmitoyltransferase Zdhhc3 [Manis pentadactyla]|nr:Palmitoyltransferase Zdhhc3 [Manis pentadactyla]
MSLGISPYSTPSFCGLAVELQLTLGQGIERLKRKHQPREHTGSWTSVKETFGGDFSLNWLNPFSGPCHPEPLSAGDGMRQVSDTDSTETTEEPPEERKAEDSVGVIGE